MIVSNQNEYIKYLTKLQIKSFRDQENVFLVEGEHLIKEAYKHNYLKELILIEGYNLDIDIKKTIVTESIMKKLSKQQSIPRCIGLVNKCKQREIIGNVLILDNIQDPGNLGTIIRSAAAFNIDTIILSNDTVDLYNDKVIRSTQGLLFVLNIIVDDLNNKIDYLKSKEYKIIGTSVNGNNKISNKYSKYALIMGNEGQGIKPSLLEKCDEIITIKTNDLVESLNVSVATSIILYELNGDK